MRKGIKNIIFDMGRVIIDFVPEIFMDRSGIDKEEDRELILKKIYHSPLWIQMDMGELDEDEMIGIVEKELPDHLSVHAGKLIKGWCDPLMMIEGMNELVFDLKAKGYGLYLLSNASRMQKDYWPNVACSICFDGVMVSAFEKLAKPDPRFYQRLLDRYDLKAEECLFVDDRKNNIEAAKSLGIDVYLFDGDAGRLRSYIERIDESFIEK